jgi:hypothetical protein
MVGSKLIEPDNRAVSMPADRSSMVSRVQLLIGHGFSVLLSDLQAHGETLGDAITVGIRESADLVAARDWIHVHTPGRRIGVIGDLEPIRSIGKLGAPVLIAAGYEAHVVQFLTRVLGATGV